VWDGLFHSRPGAAPRFSQPLSGFSKLEFHGLVSCRNRSWASPFRAFPSQRSCTPLEATGSPAVIHRRAGQLVSAALSPPVSPTPALLTQLPGSPGGYGLPFHESRPASRLPWAPDVCRPFRQLHPLRSFPPPVSPFAPSPGFPGSAAVALLGFFPSRVPFLASEPRTRRGDSTPALGETFP
jgi:hypothetical protein